MPWVPAVAAVAGAAIQSSGAQGAASTLAAGGQQGIQAQQQALAQQQANVAPYLQTGGQALSALSSALGIGGGPGQLLEADTKEGTQAPRPNQQLYASDPAYKQAWDSMITDWSNKYGKSDYSHASAEDITRQLNDRGYTQDMATKSAQNSGATGQFGSLTKPFSFDISQDPGYQFRLDQGNISVENSAAAKGSQLSGATLKELLKYGSDYASGEYNAAFNRDLATKQNTFNELAGVAGIGQQGVSQANQATGNTVNATTNLQTGIASANAAGQVGQANAIGGAINSGANNYLLSSIFKGSGSQPTTQTQAQPTLTQLSADSYVG